jgi:DNA-binding transcriptional LysR family regulator
MDWYLLRYFLAVAELGNFSRAAGQMNVTQPTLSAGIAKLEKQLGHRLFDRDKRRVSLTAAGSRFLAHARRIAHDHEVALRDISETPRQRILRVGILATLPTTIIERLVAAHARQENAEQLELIDGNERDLKTRLEDRRIDLAFTIINSHSERFAYEALGWEDYVLVAPSGHRFAGSLMVNAEDLAEDAMIIRQHCEVLAATSRYFTQRGVRPRFGVKTTNDDRALALVRAGLGVTVMPQSFQAPGICQIRLAGFDLRRQIGLIYAEDGGAYAVGSVFVTALRAGWMEQEPA